MSGKVLVVDDDPGVRLMVRKALEPDFEVVEAPDGALAREVFARERPRLALLDITLPDMEGTALIKGFVAADHCAAVIMLTSHSDIERVRAAMRLGAAEYMTKPFVFEQLRQAAIKWLGAGSRPRGAPWRRAG